MGQLCSCYKQNATKETHILDQYLAPITPITPNEEEIRMLMKKEDRDKRTLFPLRLPAELQHVILKKLGTMETLKLLKVTKSLRCWALRNAKVVRVKKPITRPIVLPDEQEIRMLMEKENRNKRTSFPLRLPAEIQHETLKKLGVVETLKLLKVTKSLRCWALRNAKVLDGWMQDALDMGVSELRKEFEQLSNWTPDGTSTRAYLANMYRNRSGAQTCGDAHRVVITHKDAQNKYIHANYVATPSSERRFICTQGPLDETIADFWLMMLQEESDTIVMLCDFVDNEGSTKCAQYFPRNENKTMRITEKLEITNVEAHHQIIDKISWLKVATFKMIYNNDGKKEHRMIRHFMWKGWREGEVPSCLRTPIELLSQIRGSQKPIVMHCGGGTGRTSILVAIEYLLECSNLKTGIPPMCDLMKELRSYRLWSILFDLQYLYIHRVIFDHFLDRQRAKFQVFHQEKNRAKYEKFVMDYRRLIRDRAFEPRFVHFGLLNPDFSRSVGKCC